MPTNQFPYPRKSSNPSPYVSTRATAYHRQRTWRTFVPLLLSGGALICLLYFILGGSSSSNLEGRAIVPGKGPPVVIVTTIDDSLQPAFVNTIKENRKDYAARHGYVTFFPNTTDYDLSSAPRSWSTIPAIRHAMSMYPQTPWVWYLTSTALIMDTRESLNKKILAPAKLESLMLVDKPVVPPDSVIKTFSHVKPERIDLILSQDKEGLAGGSMLVRNGEWAKYFLDSWFDPLFRSYNFQKAEAHALEHIVQWHGTVLAKLALVPQRIINSYAVAKTDAGGAYQEGDFIANFHGCAREKGRNCEEEMRPMLSRWRELRDGERRR
ncbi:hypothetical protein AMS68_002673 [Peltaster fructicola]|uniref:Uncharacterized protein n=1 Tax=Peltaster fructicola TaxID=286661 RepID=A0A6H0XR44_9PEZI|nr:hypothetical protein AMS68_002673 [Peltaster fructicola]